MRNKVIGVMVVTLMLLAMSQAVLVRGQHQGHGGGLTAPMPPLEFVKTGKQSGKVASFDQSSITVEVRQKGQTETVSFFITDRTKTKGEIALGAPVKVRYREEKGQKIATNIEIRRATDEQK